MLLIELPQVVMSQCTGSNREGFNVVHSAGKSPVKLDGLFNIISYDLVTKLSQAISEAHFKVSLTNPSIQMLKRLIRTISHSLVYTGLIFSLNCYCILCFSACQSIFALGVHLCTLSKLYKLQTCGSKDGFMILWRAFCTLCACSGDG